MSSLLKLLVRNLVAGIAAGWVTLGLLLAINIGGLRDVLFASSDPVLALILLAFGFTITFGSLAMGVAIMTLPYGDHPGKGKGLKIDSLLVRLRRRFASLGADRNLAPVRVKKSA